MLARLRAAEPVSWLPVLDGWLVTRYDLAVRVLRDSAAFTVDDPRFSTARVVGPSMLSLDGAAHDRHRRPFGGPFSQAEVRDRLAGFVTAEAGRLVAAVRPAGQAELRRSLAGPLATVVVARMLGLQATPPEVILAWYDAIVAAVSELAGAPGAEPGAAGVAAFGQLAERLRGVIAADDPDQSLLAAAAQHVGRSGALSTGEAVSNAAVLMFGGIETTEGMITNAAWHLLSHPDQFRLVRDDPDLLPNADRGITAAGAGRGRGGPLRHPGRHARRRDGAPGRPGHRVAGRCGPGPGGLRRPGPVRGPAGEREPAPGLRPRPALLPGRASGPAGSACRARRAAAAARAAPRPGWRRPAGGLVFRKPAALPVRWDGG